MLIIRAAQLRQLQAACDASLIDSLQRYLAQRHPLLACSADTATLRRDLARFVARATAHGFTSQLDRQRYLDLSATHGWQFEDAPEHRWMAAYLGDPDVSSPSQRLALLLDEVRYRIEAAHGERLPQPAGTLMLRELPKPD
jgi:hypothetical protein